MLYKLACFFNSWLSTTPKLTKGYVNMKKYSDQKIISSWKKNVKPWVTAIRNNEIESRVTVTNKSIVKSILQCNPKTVLDVGCGEGWLVRELEKAGIDCLGFDVVPELIENAKKQGAGRFRVISYEDLKSDSLKEKFDIITCNFSLVGNESVLNIFKQATSLLNTNGSLIIQTIHPIAGMDDYKDGWKEGSWDGFSKKFTDPAPWYFRTMGTWISMFVENGLKLEKIKEPLNPKTQNPCSIIFVGNKVS